MMEWYLSLTTSETIWKRRTRDIPDLMTLQRWLGSDWTLSNLNICYSHSILIYPSSSWLATVADVTSNISLINLVTPVLLGLFHHQQNMGRIGANPSVYPHMKFGIHSRNMNPNQVGMRNSSGNPNSIPGRERSTKQCGVGQLPVMVSTKRRPPSWMSLAIFQEGNSCKRAYWIHR